MVSKNKARGALLGLACGEMVGKREADQSRERMSSGSQPWTDTGSSDTKLTDAKRETDDIAFTVAVARSLVECDGFDPADVADRFVDLYQENPDTASDTTGLAAGLLLQGVSWENAGAKIVNSRSQEAVGCASVKRSPPLALAYPADPEKLAIASMRQSQITHADPRCTFGCAILNLTIAGYLNGVDTSLSDALSWFRLDLPVVYSDALEPVARREVITDLQSTTYVVHALQTALYDAMKASSVEDAVLTTSQRDGPAEYLCALTGAVAGARFGADSIPDRWISCLSSPSKTKMDQLADDLFWFGVES